MRKTLVLTLALMLIAAVSGAQMKPRPKSSKSPLVVTGAKPTDMSSFPRITREDAMKLYREDKAVFIDVRGNDQFRYGHIKGALSIPGSQLIARYDEVPPKKAVIAYCACDAEQSSGRAVMTLMAHGVKNVYALKGGWNEWKSAKLPIAVGPK